MSTYAYAFNLASLKYNKNILESYNRAATSYDIMFWNRRHYYKRYVKRQYLRSDLSDLDKSILLCYSNLIESRLNKIGDRFKIKHK